MDMTRFFEKTVRHRPGRPNAQETENQPSIVSEGRGWVLEAVVPKVGRRRPPLVNNCQRSEKSRCFGE
jgi:hypothetical protein